MRGDVARVLGGIVHAHHLARFGGGAGEPLAQRHVVGIDALVVADAEEVPQRLGLAVHRQDAEGVVIDQLAHGAGDLAQQLVQVQDRGELARNVGQRLQGAVLAVHAAVQARIIDGDAHARGDQPQQRAIVFRVGVDAGGLQIDHAHQFAARRHGDGQFGAHRVQGMQVARIVADIAHQHRLAARRGGSGDAFARARVRESRTISSRCPTA